MHGPSMPLRLVGWKELKRVRGMVEGALSFKEATIGDPPVLIRIRRNMRARRYILRMGKDFPGAWLTLPRNGTIEEGLDFARSRAGWIRARLDARPSVTRIEEGAVILVEGQPRVVRRQEEPGVALCDAEVRIGGPSETMGPRLAGFLKGRARDLLVPEADLLASKLGRKVHGIRFRDTRSRWGSCSADGRIMFSWRLAMAPALVWRYVVAHEVAHLVHMDHSPRFWATVEAVHPAWREGRRALKELGSQIQSVDFK